MPRLLTYEELLSLKTQESLTKENQNLMSAQQSFHSNMAELGAMIDFNDLNTTTLDRLDQINDCLIDLIDKARNYQALLEIYVQTRFVQQ